MKAEILTPSAETIARAAALLRAGEVVGMPTETVYGLAAIAFDERALAKVFAVKERPTFDPLIVHVSRAVLVGGALAGLERAGLVASEGLDAVARDRVEALAARFWPGPLTLVLPKTRRVPDLATAGLSGVGVRMPAHPVAQALIEAAGAPLAAPSANRFGRISPTTAQAVFAELGERIPAILDGGPCPVGVESTVVQVGAKGELVLLRPGGVAKESLEAAAGVALVAGAARPGVGGLVSPGTLESHYAPAKPLVLLPRSVAEMEPGELRALVGTEGPVGLLAFSDGDASERLAAATGARVEGAVLAASGSLDEAARNLFAKLRTLDESSSMRLVVEPPPSAIGLGHAILDRLRRASAKRG